jgi:N-acetylglutamate synthase-like GNAT family acetyltransferase
MDVRTYLRADRDACLAVFDSNSPDFFKSHSRQDFEEFLDGPGGPYFVMEHDGAIIGCGGYFVTAEKALARLMWGMVRRDWRRQGLGRFLLLFRLREITKAGGVEMVHLDTAPDSAPFFQSQGFKVSRVAKDGYAAGVDRVEMTMKLTVCP